MTTIEVLAYFVSPLALVALGAWAYWLDSR